MAVDNNKDDNQSKGLEPGLTITGPKKLRIFGNRFQMKREGEASIVDPQTGAVTGTAPFEAVEELKQRKARRPSEN